MLHSRQFLVKFKYTEVKDFLLLLQEWNKNTGLYTIGNEHLEPVCREAFALLLLRASKLLLRSRIAPYSRVPRFLLLIRTSAISMASIRRDLTAHSTLTVSEQKMDRPMVSMHNDIPKKCLDSQTANVSKA